MVAQAVQHLPQGSGRTEFKLDGYRALVLKDPAWVRIQRWPSAKQSLASDE
jgi:hypothetical protein